MSEPGRPITDAQNSGPLAGVVIADFSRVLAGPYATMLLADMGATVIKVESGAGDETRAWNPPARDDISTYYLSINRNKRSIVLDFNDSADIETAKQIIKKADVFIENFKPGGLEKFGLDYDSVQSLNPAIVYASITGFGTAGGAKLPGYDLLVQASSGVMSLTGNPDGDPMRAGFAVVDIVTGLHTAIGILTALYKRQIDGQGQRVETNLLSSALSALTNHSGATILTDVIPLRMGNEHPSIYPYEPIPTKDGDIIIAVGNNRQFQVLCDALEIPQIALDERFSTVAKRNDNRSELKRILREIFRKRTTAQWFDLLSDVGVPCAPINNVREGIELATKLGLDPVAKVGSGNNTMPGVANPLRFSKNEIVYELLPPALNQDEAEIKNWLAGNFSNAAN